RAGNADFTAILVYDVSRWGRFQDSDESAFYEYTCKRAGITVQYCAEQFTNDGTVGSTIIKTVKRAMAGEYSRELSAKVFKGQCRRIRPSPNARRSGRSREGRPCAGGAQEHPDGSRDPGPGPRRGDRRRSSDLPPLHRRAAQRGTDRGDSEFE